jgi:uncharacterized protein
VTAEKQQQLARKFLSILGRPDAELVRNVTIDDVVWSFPGTSPISGEARGVDAIMRRARTIASCDVKVEIIRAVHGFSGIAIILHNTGNRNDRILDEHLAAVFSFRDDRICRLDTYLSDIEMAERFFA